MNRDERENALFVVKNCTNKKAVQEFIKRCFSLCLQVVKNSDLWFKDESSGWKRMWCFSRIHNLQMLVMGFQGGAFLRISHLSVYPIPIRLWLPHHTLWLQALAHLYLRPVGYKLLSTFLSPKNSYIMLGRA